MVTRFAKQLVLNQSVEFDQPPSGLMIAREIGLFLQERALGRSRPFACHVFVIDSMQNQIYEVNCAGIFVSVKGGVCGSRMQEGYLKLKENIEILQNLSGTEVEAKRIVETVLELMCNKNISENRDFVTTVLHDRGKLLEY